MQNLLFWAEKEDRQDKWQNIQGGDSYRAGVNVGAIRSMSFNFPCYWDDLPASTETKDGALTPIIGPQLQVRELQQGHDAPTEPRQRLHSDLHCPLQALWYDLQFHLQIWHGSGKRHFMHFPIAGQDMT